MALGDLLQMLTMPQGQGIGTMSGYTPASPAQPQTPLTPATGSPVPTSPPVSGDPNTGLLSPDPNMIMGHHVNNLLQVTGNLQPPPGVSVPSDQTQANIPGGYHTPAPVDQGPDPSDPHQYRDAVNGPFKTHGVAGDILGHLMDMVLVSGGLKPEYSNRVQAAKQADAIHGYQNDPTGSLERLASVAGVPEATAFQTGVDSDVNSHNEQALRSAKAQIDAVTARNTQNLALNKAHTYQANLAGTLIGSDPKDPKTIQKAKLVAAAIRADREKYNDDTPVPDDPEGLLELANSAVTPYQHIQSQNLQDYRDSQAAEAHARTQIQQGRLSIADRNASSEASLRDYKMNHPTGQASDPEYRAARLAHMQNAVRLQNQKLGSSPKLEDTKKIGDVPYYKYGGGWHTVPPK